MLFFYSLGEGNVLRTLHTVSDAGRKAGVIATMHSKSQSLVALEAPDSECGIMSIHSLSE